MLARLATNVDKAGEINNEELLELSDLTAQNRASNSNSRRNKRRKNRNDNTENNAQTIFGIQRALAERDTNTVYESNDRNHVLHMTPSDAAEF